MGFPQGLVLCPATGSAGFNNITGLSVWIYSQYKHLKEMPAIKRGERVKTGEMEK